MHYVIFTRRRSMTTIPSILTIDGLHVERVTAYKYLGIWLDEKLVFDVHIDCLVKKLQPRLFFFVSAKTMLFLRIMQTMFYPS